MVEKILHFVTWNINGIKDKFPNVLRKLSNMKADVAFIQETHVGPQCCPELNNDSGWKAFYTVYDSKIKGVAILVKDHVEFNYICHDEDYCGGYFVLFCHLYGKLYTLVNVYRHPTDSHVLGRLKDYLMETAEGLLVVGGDFNMVLDPSFDRQLKNPEDHPLLRSHLEDFTASLNLRDTWSYLHHTDEGFTWESREQRSRIDMFFMSEDTMRCVRSIQVINNTDISDHYPLLLKFTDQRQSKYEEPNIAMMLTNEHRYKPDRELGKINGAEILSAIKSLTDSGEQSSFDLDLGHYKKYRVQSLETLKMEFNLMLKNSSYSGTTSINSVIFSQILAKRLGVLLTPSFREGVKEARKRAKTKQRKNDILLTASLASDQQRIKWSYLKHSIKRLKQIHFAPPPDPNILSSFLPRDFCSFGELRNLYDGSPITKSIINLALKQLGDSISKHKIPDGHEFTTTVCFHRQALRVHGDLSNCETIKALVIKLMEDSGLKLTIT